MIDLDELKVPRYEIKLDGKVMDYDPLEVAWKLKDAALAKEPQDVQTLVNQTFKIEVSIYQTAVILKDFFDYAAENLDETLKNVLGPERSLPTTLASDPKSKQDLASEPASVTSTASPTLETSES